MLLLDDGPRDMETILETLKTKRSALLPQIKLMEEKHLLIKDDGVCELTTIGELLMSKTLPLLSMVNFFDKDMEYWGSHNIDFIPIELLKRVDEIGNYTIIEPELPEIFEMNRVFDEGLRRTKKSRIVTSIIYPDSMEVLHELSRTDIDMEFVTTQKILNKFRTENYEKLCETMESGQIKFFVYNEKIRFPAFAQNDDGLFLFMSKKDGTFENRLLLSRTPGALEWGREFFEYYKEDVTQVFGMQHLEKLLA